ncbi:hypothetical protein KAJ38_01380 [Candidatus Pacearchaeota archaeon]|nr:hypothetical protein [Candidatus Pacearchaeota archaeon]
MAIENLEKIENHSICMKMGHDIRCDDRENKYLNKDSDKRRVATIRIEGATNIAKINRDEYFNSLTNPAKKENCINCEFNPNNYREKLALYQSR